MRAHLFPEPKVRAAAVAADEQRRRLAERAKVLRQVSVPHRVCVVVGGRGVLRRLSDTLAGLIGDLTVVAGFAPETVDEIRARVPGRFPRVVFLCSSTMAAPISTEICSYSAAWGLGWPEPVEILRGLKSRDRDAFLRQSIRRARGAT